MPPALRGRAVAADDDHQSKNAAHFARVGAAMVLDQRTSSAEDLAVAIASLATDSGKQLAMSQAMREVARPRAAPNALANAFLPSLCASAAR